MNFKQSRKAFKELFLQVFISYILAHIRALKRNGRSGKFAVLSTYALSLAFQSANTFPALIQKTPPPPNGKCRLVLHIPGAS